MVQLPLPLKLLSLRSLLFQEEYKLLSSRNPFIHGPSGNMARESRLN